MHLALTLIGIAPLIVQSDRLVDPLDPLTRELALLVKKRPQTDEDIAEVGRLEFYGALYYDSEVGPYLPGDNIQASLRHGGSFVGRLGKAVERAVVVLNDVNRIEYQGPRDVDDLWADTNHRLRRSVVNSGRNHGRTMRTRPIFRRWRVETAVELATDLMNPDDFRRVAETAGHMAGVGTWRPRYGRYDVEVKRP